MRILSLIILSFILFLLSSCRLSGVKVKAKMTEVDPVEKKTPPMVGLYQVAGDSLIIPPFSVEIQLSPKASKRMVGTAETIVLDAYFNGEPINDMKSVKFEEDGSFFLGSSTHEIRPGETVRFENIKFSREKYDQLKEKDIDVMVNVYSGRHTSGDNLLNCDFLSDKMSKVANKHFVLKAKLIYGDDQ